MNYSETAKQLLEQLGGDENIVSLTHCMTRLRFNLKDESGVNDKKIEKIPGVMGTMRKNGQYQVIIGNNVANCYNEILKISNFSAAVTIEEPAEKQNVFNTVLDFVSSCMTPLFPAIIAGGLVKVLLVLLGGTVFGVLSETGDTYIILNAIGDSAFYFLPVLVAVTASKKLNCHTYLAAMVASVLVYPDLITLLGADAPTKLFGFIPVIHGSYASSIIPAMLATVLLKYVEKFVDKICPSWTKNFLKPLLIVLICAPITLCALAPIGGVVGNGLQFVLNAIYGFAPWLAMGLFAGFMPFIVMTGMHWAFIPTTIMALANPGYELMFLPGVLCSNLAQAGATFAVSVKSKDSKTKQIALPAAISALLAGVTEPAIFGITLRFKKVMYAACAASGICGVIVGFIKLKAYAFATPALTSLVMFIGKDAPHNFMYACMIAAISFVLSFIFAWFVFKDEKETMEEEIVEEMSKAPEVAAPLKGKLIPLAEVNDATFSSEVLGKGFAVIPSVGEVRAPFDGTVSTVIDTKHALGLSAASGIEVLIHVGLETVELCGKHFEPQVQEGDSFKKGDILLKFDLDEIKKAGYDTTTPVIITNADEFPFEKSNNDQVSFGDQVVTF